MKYPGFSAVNRSLTAEIEQASEKRARKEHAWGGQKNWGEEGRRVSKKGRKGLSASYQCLNNESADRSVSSIFRAKIEP